MRMCSGFDCSRETCNFKMILIDCPDILMDQLQSSDFYDRFFVLIQQINMI